MASRNPPLDTETCPTADLRFTHPGHQNYLLDIGNAENIIDAAEYKKWFEEAFQYFQSRCQHHIHSLKRDKKIGAEKRIVPNACACKKIRKSANMVHHGPISCLRSG